MYRKEKRTAPTFLRWRQLFTLPLYTCTTLKHYLSTIVLDDNGKLSINEVPGVLTGVGLLPVEIFSIHKAYNMLQ